MKSFLPGDVGLEIELLDPMLLGVVVETIGDFLGTEPRKLPLLLLFFDSEIIDLVATGSPAPPSSRGCLVNRVNLRITEKQILKNFSRQPLFIYNATINSFFFVFKLYLEKIPFLGGH